MYFKRKAYDRLLEWKAKYSDKYAALLEGVKRVGKSTIAESFGQNEYKSYLLIDFSKTTDNICLLYTSPSPRDGLLSRMPSSA